MFYFNTPFTVREECHSPFMLES